MTVTLQSGSYARNSSTWPLSSPYEQAATITVAAGSNMVLCLLVGSKGDSGSHPAAWLTPQVDGVDMIEHNRFSAAQQTENLWYFMAPSAGSHTVKLRATTNFGGSGHFIMDVFVLEGVDQTTPFGTRQITSGASGPSSPMTTAVTVAAGGIALITHRAYGTGAAINLAADGSETLIGTRYDWTAHQLIHAYKANATSAVQTWNNTGLADDQAGQMAIPVNPAAVAPDLSSNVTLDDVVAAGTLQSSSSDLSGNVTLDALVATGTIGLQPGTCAIPALKNWNGSLATNEVVPWVTFCRLTDAVQVLILVNQTTHASAATLSVTNGALVQGTWYMAIGFNADGSKRFAVPVQAT